MTVLTSRRYRLPRGVTADDLDLRWLTRRHRDQLAAGELRIPPQANHFGHGGHDATLVSVYAYLRTTEVAWIDTGMAELVYRLNHHHDIETIECCQGESWDDPAYVAFADKRDVPRFQALAGDALRHEHVTRWVRQAAVYFPPAQVKRITRAVRNA